MQNGNGVYVTRNTESNAIIASYSGTIECSDLLLLLENVGEERQKKLKKVENMDVRKNEAKKVAYPKAFSHILTLIREDLISQHDEMRCQESHLCGACTPLRPTEH